jgi:hypothetical protein
MDTHGPVGVGFISYTRVVPCIDPRLTSIFVEKTLCPCGCRVRHAATIDDPEKMRRRNCRSSNSYRHALGCIGRRAGCRAGCEAAHQAPWSTMEHFRLSHPFLSFFCRARMMSVVAKRSRKPRRPAQHSKAMRNTFRLLR